MPESVVDNQLSFIDQAGFQLLRATGRHQLMQITWVYEHDLDVDGLKRFHQNIGGLFGRRIERSPLPFGRHRWVRSTEPRPEIEFVADARPREELSDWMDERSQLPVDPEHGPAWHIAVLPMSDGATAITLVASHNLGDGVAGVLTIFDAVTGAARDFGFPPPRSRTRRQAAMVDLRHAVRQLPDVGRAAARAARLLTRRRDEITRTGESRAAVPVVSGPDNPLVVPAIAVYVDLPQWDSRAEALGATSYSLLAGFGAALGDRLGRSRRDDGEVTLSIALNDRSSLDDTRAIAMSFAGVSVDPSRASADLTAARAAIRDGIAATRATPDETLELLPLIPLVPRRVLGSVAGLFYGSPNESPVFCSNLGDIDPAVGRPDGTPAEYVLMRGVDQNVTRHTIEQMGGQLVLVSARINGKISIGIVGYQPGAENSKVRLRRLAAETLADFGLTGVID